MDKQFHPWYVSEEKGEANVEMFKKKCSIIDQVSAIELEI